MKYRRLLSLVNQENMNKCIYTLRRCGWRVLCTKLRLKLGSDATRRLLGDEPVVYRNDCLYTPRRVERTAAPVDILVPVYNSYEFVCRCLDTLWEHTTFPYFLHVLDDCSSDPRIGAYLRLLQERPRPLALQGLQVTRNEANLGFVQNVNRGLAAARHDVLLLNTDTEVSAGWLERLTAVLASDDRIASVTPFSNSATICSFPEMGVDNELYGSRTAAELDACFADCGFNRPVDLPSGVGFCMLLRRRTLQELGGFSEKDWEEGYGEENDWCCRAAAAGWRNVLAPDVFVYHKHGVSFSAAGGKSRRQRIQSHLGRLHQRYPGYELAVTRFASQDTLYPLRQLLRWRIDAGSRPGMLFLNHSLGGGTQVYQDHLIADLRDTWHILTMALQADGRSLALEHPETGETMYLDLRQLDGQQFRRLLEVLGIQRLYINQLISYPLERVLEWLAAGGVPYTYFIHDFYCLCPSYNLMDAQGTCCLGSQDEERCARCIAGSPGLSWAGLPAGRRTIAAWRGRFGQLLNGAAEAAAPSRSAAAIVRRCYPGLEITVREHSLCVPVCRTFSPDFLRDEMLEISLLGAISDVKGAKLLYQLERQIRREGLPIRLNVIGYTSLEDNPRESRSLRITGPYAKEEGARLLGKYHTALVMILSLWPETFSYTTSEAMSAGYPVLCFDIGAPAERVRRTGAGWIVPDLSADALLNQLKYLLGHRDEIAERAKKTQERNCR